MFSGEVCLYLFICLFLAAGFQTVRVGIVGTPLGTITLSCAYRTNLALMSSRYTLQLPVCISFQIWWNIFYFCSFVVVVMFFIAFNRQFERTGPIMGIIIDHFVERPFTNMAHMHPCSYRCNLHKINQSYSMDVSCISFKNKVKILFLSLKFNISI